MTWSFPTSRPNDETILVVDDSRETRTLMATILEQEGYRVLEARNGEHALDVAAMHARVIDLIVTDARMPVMGGVELMERFRRWYPALRCLVVSGYADVLESLDEFEGTPTALLAKPFTPDQLASAVHELLDRPSRVPTLHEWRNGDEADGADDSTGVR